MNNKCEWKDDGHVLVCDKLMNWMQQSWARPDYAEKNFDKCPFCGADIRKPEPEEPLIVKSGDTCVAHFEGVDYLILNPAWWVAETSLTLGREIKKFEDEIKTGRWVKPFTDKNGKHVDENGKLILELTDEIAKLRPMVQRRDIYPSSSILYGVSKDNKAILTDQNHISIDNFRLMEAHELQEAESVK